MIQRKSFMFALASKRYAVSTAEDSTQGTDAYIPFLGALDILGHFWMYALVDLLLQSILYRLHWIDSPNTVRMDRFPNGKAYSNQTDIGLRIRLRS